MQISDVLHDLFPFAFKIFAFPMNRNSDLGSNVVAVLFIIAGFAKFSER